MKQFTTGFWLIDDGSSFKPAHLSIPERLPVYRKHAIYANFIYKIFTPGH
jgi:hypothetical protein